MARIEGVKDAHATLLSRILYWVARKRLGRLPEMWRIAAHVPRLHLGRAVSELLLDRSRLVDRPASQAGRCEGCNGDRLSGLNRFRLCRGQSSRSD